MKLYLIRHAESLNNAKPVHDRVPDPSLSPLGRLQAQHLANWLTTFRHDVLITSPFRRTLETTRVFLDQVPRPVHVWHHVFEQGGCFSGYNEANFAGAAGLGRSAIRQLACREPEHCLIDETITEQGWWNRPDRESQEETDRRAGEVRDRLVNEFAETNQSVVAVIHADFIRGLLQAMIGDVINVDRLGPIVNVGVTRLRYDDGDWHLDWLNSVTHLPSRLVTGREH